MSQIIKGYLGVFLVLLLMVTGIGILTAFMEVIYAQDIHAGIIDELENSAYAKCVLEESFDKVQQAGQDLTVTLFYEDGRSLQVSSKADIPADSMEASYARVELEFPLKIVFFQFNQKYMLNGYAR